MAKKTLPDIKAEAPTPEEKLLLQEFAVICRTNEGTRVVGLGSRQVATIMTGIFDGRIPLTEGKVVLDWTNKAFLK